MKQVHESAPKRPVRKHDAMTGACAIGGLLLLVHMCIRILTAKTRAKTGGYIQIINK